MNQSMLAIGMPGTTELIVIAVVALLIFGRRLPDVARSVGKSIVEFKKGIREAKDDIDADTPDSGRRNQPRLDQQSPVESSSTTKTSGRSSDPQGSDKQTVPAEDSNASN